MIQIPGFKLHHLLYLAKRYLYHLTKTIENMVNFTLNLRFIENCNLTEFDDVVFDNSSDNIIRCGDGNSS